MAETAFELDYLRYYGRWHDDSEEHFKSASAGDYDSLKPFLPGKDAKVLDLGCGMGFALGGLQSAGYINASGIDCNEAQVNRANRRGLHVDLVAPENTIAYLQKNAPYDLVFSLDVIEHIPREELLPLLREVKAALKPGAKFICRTPNCDSIVAGRFRYNDWTHQSQFGDASLDFVLHNAGFRDIQVLPSPDPLPRRLRSYPRWIARRVLRGLRRAELLSELGFQEATHVPLSPNIWGIGHA
jgi:SAM-dependent methyltransferase